MLRWQEAPLNKIHRIDCIIDYFQHSVYSLKESQIILICLVQLARVEEEESINKGPGNNQKQEEDQHGAKSLYGIPKNIANLLSLPYLLRNIFL